MKLLWRLQFTLNTFVCVSPVNLCQFSVQTQSGTLRGSRKTFSSSAVKDTTSPGRGNGTPLQYSCWGNLTDRGAWWATVHGITRVGCDWAQHSTAQYSWRDKNSTMPAGFQTFLKLQLTILASDESVLLLQYPPPPANFVPHTQEIKRLALFFSFLLKGRRICHSRIWLQGFGTWHPQIRHFSTLTILRNSKCR